MRPPHPIPRQLNEMVWLANSIKPAHLVLVAEMTNSHLVNVIRYLRRKVSERDGFVGTPALDNALRVRVPAYRFIMFVAKSRGIKLAAPNLADVADQEDCCEGTGHGLDCSHHSRVADLADLLARPRCFKRTCCPKGHRRWMNKRHWTRLEQATVDSAIAMLDGDRDEHP